MHYLPLPLPFFALLVGAFLVLVALIQIGILLPIPEALRPALEAAQVKRAGLLMSDAVSLSKGASSVYRFSTAPTTGKRRP